MAGQRSLSTSFSSFSYDVFISFRGSDTQYGFTGSLYKALSDMGIRTFFDDEELQRIYTFFDDEEESIPPLFKEVELSKIAIIVLSQNYAFSSFCLDELSKILDCKKEMGQLVIPVFYQVDPSDVRELKGAYGEAMATHEERFKDNKERLIKWKIALNEVVNLSGFHFKDGDGYEYQTIEKIVKQVHRKIFPRSLHVPVYTVGLESRLQDVYSLLDVGSDHRVLIVGIWGIGGIGKSTLAEAIHNLIARHFEGCCFLDNIRENSSGRGLVNLQEKLLFDMLGENFHLGNVSRGAKTIASMLCQKKVLLILDDVDRLEQLEALVGRPDWFGHGSRVVITTRNKHLLAIRGVEKTYKVEELSNKDALELLRRQAFRDGKVDPSHTEVLNQVVTYAYGLPLALKVMGSYLFGRSVEEWKSALEKLKWIPDGKNLEILKVSFDDLDEEDKSVFLDIASCFKGYELAEVENILYAHYDYQMNLTIEVFVDKSLISITADGKVILHPLIEEMVRDEDEREFIERMVEVVSSKIIHLPLHVADYPVGLESRVLEVISLLDVGSDDGVHMVGIYGIGGIGKTTLARAVYNSIAEQFGGLCFLENVKYVSSEHGLVNLQQKLIFDILGEEGVHIRSVNEGISIIKHRLHQKKILLILDDVDKFEQLESMVGGSDWFGFGSKVIITTRDKHLLATYGVERTYEVKKLNEKDALELLSWNAFKTDKYGPSYGNILNLAINFAFGIPLVLEVIGSNFFGLSIEEWEAEFNQHAITLDKEIQDMAQEESSRQPGNLSRVWFGNEWTYDIFLSFSGLDTRTGFIGYLYNALVEKGICSFIGDMELQRGEKITLGTRKEIEESRIAVIVLSKCYVSSSYCLDELANIIECIQGKGQLVLPIFYDVDPSDILHERGSCGEALFNHEKKFKDNQVKMIKWRTALLQTANLSGWHIKHGGGYEYEFIERIVEEISRKISRVPLDVADHPIGLRSQVLEVKSILDVGFDDGVLVVGIHGICGIGKTAIARAVYNLIADHFESLCFIENVKKNSNKHGLVHLQEIFLSKVVGEKKIKLVSVKQGISIIKHRLQRKKVLLILDDVDKLEQVEVTAGGSDWFGAGSRIIITTRDKELLATHGVKRIYEVKELNRKEAFQLLSWKGFRTNNVAPSYREIADSAVTHASGLPFALELMGSNLFGKSIEECESSFTGYELMLAKGIPDILRVSFDGLDEVEKNIFLDIACFFEGYELAVIENILCAHYGVDMKYGIRVLAEKTLIKINQYDEVTFPDLMQDMGREIVRQESPEEPGKRSRLWFYEDIVHVLEENTGTSQTQIIILEFPLFKEEVVEWDGEAFKKMQDLKTLIIRNGCFSKGPNHLPNSLRVLEWEGYPSQSLPSDFHPEKLAIFKLASICFMSLELLNLHKKFMNLRVLGIDECESITQIPDFSGLPNLEKLSFVYCENLIKIHESVGFLNKLRILDIEGCCKIRTFPPMKLASLEELYLSHCSSLESFPEILAKMENITLIGVHHTPINELPSSIGNLTRLRRLELHGCGMLQLPSGIAMLPELEELSVWQCEGLQPFNQDKCEEKVSSTLKQLDFLACNISDEVLRTALAWFTNVRELDLSLNIFTTLPACFKECFFLRKLTVDYCKHLQEIRGIPPNLETFSAKWCTSLNYIDLTVHLAGIKRSSFVRELIVDDCENLREIIGISPYIELLSATYCTSLTSLCSSVLLNQEMHEAGNKRFCLPGTRIPRWFEHCTRGPSISFWFRNEFPASLSLCLVGLVHVHPVRFRPMMIINGNKMRTEFLTEKWFNFEFLVGTDHMLIFGEKQIKFKDNLDEVLLENEWNHVVVSIDIDLTLNPTVLSVIQTGLHVFKQSSMEDIRFSDPYGHPFLKVKHDGGVSQRQFIQKQNKLSSLALLETSLGVLKSCSSTTSVQGIQEQEHLTSIIQGKFEGCEKEKESKGKQMVEFNHSNDEDSGKGPLMELLSIPSVSTKEYQVRSEKRQPVSNDKTMAWDPMELEYQVTHTEDQSVSNDENSHVMGFESNERSSWWQFCFSALINSAVSLCSSSSSLAAS